MRDAANARYYRVKQKEYNSRKEGGHTSDDKGQGGKEEEEEGGGTREKNWQVPLSHASPRTSHGAPHPNRASPSELPNPAVSFDRTSWEAGAGRNNKDT